MQVLHLHYKLLLRGVGQVPVGVLYGDVQTGKQLQCCQLNHYREHKNLTTERGAQMVVFPIDNWLVLDDLTDVCGILEKPMVLFDALMWEVKPSNLEHHSQQH